MKNNKFDKHYELYLEEKINSDNLINSKKIVIKNNDNNNNDGLDKV
jgi:hypothetical protein